MAKSREKTNMTAILGTSKPDCEATLLWPGQFRLGQGGLLVGETEWEVEEGGFCLDRGRVRVCNDTIMR